MTDADIIHIALDYAGESFDLRDDALSSHTTWAYHLPSEARELWPHLTIRERALLVIAGSYAHELTYL